MKLLAVSSWFPDPPDNGSKLRAFHLLSQLARHHEVTLLSFAEAGEGGAPGPLTTRCARVRTVTGNPFKPTRALRGRDFFARMPRSYAQTYSSHMQELVDASVPNHDAAIALQLGAALYLAKHARIPRVFDEIEVGSLRDGYRRLPAGPARWRRGLTWLKYGRFVRSLASSFERATVVSQLERQYCAEMGLDMSAVRVVANGVERRLIHRAFRTPSARIVYSGAVTYSSNLDAVRYFARDILPLVHAARADATFHVTGTTAGVDVADLSQAGATFAGRVEDIAAFVGESAVCVVPLRQGGGTRLKILEAMAVGTPVVATTKGAEGLDVEGGRDLLIADSPAEFAEQVVRVMNDADLRARLAGNGRRLVESLYTWDRIGEGLEKILGEAVHVHAGRSFDRTDVKTGRATATA